MIHAIVYRVPENASGYAILYGHCCYTKEDMDEYCQALNPEGEALKVVQLPFDVTNTANKDYVDPPQLLQEEISPFVAAIMREALEDLMSGKFE